MSVNLLGTKGFAQSHELLQRSFAQFQTDGSVVHYAQDIEHAQKEKQESEQGLRADITRLAGTGRAGKAVIPEDVDEAYDELLSFAALRQDLNSAERETRVTAHEERGKEISSYLASLNRGDVIALPTGKNPDLAVVVAPARFPKDPAPVIITDHGWNGRIRAADMGNLPITVGHMRLPGHPKRQSKKITQATSSALRKARFDKPKRIKQISSSGHSQKVRGLQQALHDHPVYDWPEREALAHWAQKVLKAQRTIDYLEFHAHGGKGLGKQFDSILNLLSELDYVDSPDGQANSNSTVTAEGDHLADIHHELDLLIAQSLRRGIWDDLDPAELAAVVSTVSFENRREKSGKTKYPTENVDKAISATQRVYGELASDENRYGIDQSRELDTSFALALHQWTTGAPLEYCLQAANYSGAELTIGDFVRSCRQAIEVLEQIKRSGYSDDIRKNARQAVQAINTGVVQLSA